MDATRSLVRRASRPATASAALLLAAFGSSDNAAGVTPALGPTTSAQVQTQPGSPRGSAACVTAAPRACPA